MTYDYHRRTLCPLCESGELRAVNPSQARCSRCQGTMDYGFFDTLRQLRALPDATGKHACECSNPEMRRLSDGMFRCPACGSEVTPRAEPLRGLDTG